MTNPLTPWDELNQRVEKAEKFALEQGAIQTEINQQLVSELRDIWKEIQQLQAQTLPWVSPNANKPFSQRD